MTPEKRRRGRQIRKSRRALAHFAAAMTQLGAAASLAAVSASRAVARLTPDLKADQ